MRKIFALQELAWELIIFSLFLVANIPLGYSVPAPRRLALNHETKECGMYWAGDEFTRYELPSGWKSYEINYTSGLVKTEVGNCIINLRSETSIFKECCEQLGYTYIPGNIGEKAGRSPLPGLIFSLRLVWIAIIVGLGIFLYFFIKRVKS